MADYNSSLPIRSEADGTDERVHVKVVDGSNPALRMTVDSDLNAHVEMHGNDPAGVDRVVRTSEAGALTPDGVYNAASNTKPGNIGLVANSRNASPGDATQTERLTSVQDSAGSIRALDVSLHDEDGEAFSASNPLPVTLADAEGEEVNDYNTASAVAAAAVSNHTYTAAADMKLSQIHAAASGKMKVEVQVETGVASGTYETKFVRFNSTASPNIIIDIKENIDVGSGVRVQVIRTNLDNQPQDVYSTICGHEI